MTISSTANALILQAKDLHTLERVRTLIEDTKSTPAANGESQSRVEVDNAIEATRVYALFVQATSVLEDNNLDGWFHSSLIARISDEQRC